MDFDLDPWITRLRQQVPLLRTVAGAAELAAVRKTKPALPGVWVVPVGDQGGANPFSTGGVSQRTVERVGVVIAVSNVSDPRGEAAHNALRVIRRAVKTSLIGWLPAAAEDEVLFARGHLVDYSDQVLWWQDDYLGAFYETKP